MRQSYWTESNGGVASQLYRDLDQLLKGGHCVSWHSVTISHTREKRRKECPHTGDSTILRLPFSQGSPIYHQCHAVDQAFATWAFGRHSGCNPQLSLAADSIHTHSLPSEILGLQSCPGHMCPTEAQSHL